MINRSTHQFRAILAVICLAILAAACGDEEAQTPPSGSDTGTPTTAIVNQPTMPPAPTMATATETAGASPTSESDSTPEPSLSLADLPPFDWQLVEIDGAPVLAGTITTLTFWQPSDNAISGHADCHSYMAGIAWDDTSFRIDENGPISGGLVPSEWPCRTPVGGAEQDAAFFDALVATTAYHASAERLTLLDGDGQARLAFTPRPALSVDPALTGTAWLLAGIDGGAPLPGTTISLALSNAGIFGNDGCNEVTGSILAADRGRLIFTDVSGTDMGCETPEGIMGQAERFTELLVQVTQYQIDSDQLQMIDSSGAVTLLFVRQDVVAFDSALAAHRWALIGTDEFPVLPGSLITLELAEGSVSGSDGCNLYGGELLRASDGVLKVTGFTQTAVSCDHPILLQAESFRSLLGAATSYQIDGDRLTLSGDSRTKLVFAPQAEALLIGSAWRVPMLYTLEPTGEVRGDALVEGTELTIEFHEDGRITGSTGCNRYQGTYQVDGATVTVSSLAQTLKACDKPILDQEARFLDTLEHVATWSFGMHGLTLATDDGRELRELEHLAQ